MREVMCKEEVSRGGGHWISVWHLILPLWNRKKSVCTAMFHAHQRPRCCGVGEKRPLPKCCLRRKAILKPLHQTNDDENMCVCVCVCVGRLKGKKTEWREKGREGRRRRRGSIMKKNGRLQIKCANICLVVPFSDFERSSTRFSLSVLLFLKPVKHSLTLSFLDSSCFKPCIDYFLFFLDSLCFKPCYDNFLFIFLLFNYNLCLSLSLWTWTQVCVCVCVCVWKRRECEGEGFARLRSTISSPRAKSLREESNRRTAAPRRRVTTGRTHIARPEGLKGGNCRQFCFEGVRVCVEREVGESWHREEGEKERERER